MASRKRSTRTRTAAAKSRRKKVKTAAARGRSARPGRRPGVGSIRRPAAPPRPRKPARGGALEAPTNGELRQLEALTGVPEEERIESAKYLPRHVPKRVFDEQRFLFPESYGVNRVRLLVKDPDWLFAHWDVDPGTLAGLERDLGRRTLALSRLTLRVADATHGGATVILLPSHARSWYVRADRAPRTYRAELGLTLPSGEFRRMAESNAVTTPRVGPSPERARRRVRWDGNGRHVDALAHGAEGEALPADDAVGPLPDRQVVGRGGVTGTGRARGGRGGREDGATSGELAPSSRRGGGSDLYRR